MEQCKICKTPIDSYDAYVHEYSFGTTLKTELTHTGICAEIFEECLQSVYTKETDDEEYLKESLENIFDGYQII